MANDLYRAYLRSFLKSKAKTARNTARDTAKHLSGVWDSTIAELAALGYGPAKPAPKRRAAKTKKTKVK